MTFDQITTLLDRGFTPDQITMLTTSGDPTTPDSGAAADDSFHPQETEPAAPPSPDPDPAPAPAPDPAPAADMNPVLDAIADLKAAVQANNIKTMSMPGVSGEKKKKKAMAEIIRPSFKKGD